MSRNNNNNNNNNNNRQHANNQNNGRNNPFSSTSDFDFLPFTNTFGGLVRDINNIQGLFNSSNWGANGEHGIFNNANLNQANENESNDTEPKTADGDSSTKSVHNCNLKCNLIETKEAYFITAELPGLHRASGVEVNFDEGLLTISGSRWYQEREDGDQYHYEEIPSDGATFNRSFKLERAVNDESIEASFDDGFLHITIQKVEEKSNKRKIEIN
jgi:HSP20 family protein